MHDHGDGVIELEQVVRTFGDVRAVDGVSLTVERGEVLGLLGHNGAGKTTTVRLIAGLLAPTSGRVAVGGLDPQSDGPEVRRRLGVMSANPSVDDRLTGRANLRFAADLYELPADAMHDRIAAKLAEFGLTERADERAGDYSTGMRQRLALARVLLHDPDVLLLDEPTAALDPVAARQVRSVISRLASERGRTVVLCTHDLAEAELLCDRLAVLQQGVVKASGTAAELAAALAPAEVEVVVHVDDVPAAVGVDAGVAPRSSADGRLTYPGMSREQIPALISRLALADVRVFEVVRRQASLEDVYFAVHGEERS